MHSKSENADIFTGRDEIYLVFVEKKSKKSQPYFLLGRFSFDLTFAVCLLGITLGET